jgi:hypothetical protein
VIEENSCRGPKFQEERAVQVTFAGGSKFLVPRPWLVIRPTFQNGRAVYANAKVEDPEVEVFLTTLRESHPVAEPTAELGFASEAERLAEEDDRNTKWLLAAAELAACLLRRNYDLSDDQLTELLTVTADSDWVSRVPRIARGLE